MSIKQQTTFASDFHANQNEIWQPEAKVVSGTMIGVHLSDVFLMSVNYDLISRMQGCAGITVALRLGNLPGKRTALKAEVPSATAVAHGHELHQYTACGDVKNKAAAILLSFYNHIASLLCYGLS